MRDCELPYATFGLGAARPLFATSLMTKRALTPYFPYFPIFPGRFSPSFSNPRRSIRLGRAAYSLAAGGVLYWRSGV